MSTELNKQIARRHFEELWLNGALAVADEIYSTEAVGHCRDLPDVTGYPEAEKEEVRQSNTGFPDTSVVIDFQVAEGDKVVTRWRVEGTNTGPLYGNPPTGRSISVTGCHIHRIVDGKIVEVWSHADNLTFMKQLGMIPSEEEEGAVR